MRIAGFVEPEKRELELAEKLGRKKVDGADGLKNCSVTGEVFDLGSLFDASFSRKDYPIQSLTISQLIRAYRYYAVISFPLNIFSIDMQSSRI